MDGAKALPAPVEQPLIAAAPTEAPVNPFGDDDEDEVEVAPVKRVVKKETVAAAPKPELKEALGEWLDDDED
jgi:hypothetical protein